MAFLLDVCLALCILLKVRSAICSEACVSSSVKSTQKGDGVCDLACNSPVCGFDEKEGNDCLAECAQSGCDVRLLGNGECDEHCEGLECGFDRGDCGYCSLGCFQYMLGDEVCHKACSGSACDFDECQACAPHCYAQELFVLERGSQGDGSLANPYERFASGLLSASQPVVVIYLLGEQISWVLNSTSPELDFKNSSISYMRVQSLQCQDRITPGCSNTATEIDVVGLMTLSVSFELVFERVKFTSKALFAGRPRNYCPFLRLEDGEWVDARGDPASQELVATAGVCELFKDLSLFIVLAGGSLTLRVSPRQNVNVTDLTIQPHAFVSIQGGNMTLENVHFLDFHTRRGSDIGGVVLQTEMCSTYMCGSFTFENGSVSFMNNGLEYAASVLAGPFLYGKSLETLSIEGVTFEYNFVVGAYSNPLSTSEQSLIYLKNFYAAKVSNCAFRNNFVSGGLIVVESSVVLPKFAQDGVAYLYLNPHISLSEISFDSNLCEHTLIEVKMSGDVLNIQITGLQFTNNAIEGESMLSFVSASAASDSIASGSSITAMNPLTGVKEEMWVPPRFLRIAMVEIVQSLAFIYLAQILNLANVDVAGLEIRESGDFDPDVLARVLSAYASDPRILSSLTPVLPSPPQCSIFILTDGCLNTTMHSLAVSQNSCSYGTCGVRVINNPAFVSISHYLSEGNNCTSQSALAIDAPQFVNAELHDLVFRGNINYEAEMMIFGFQSIVSLKDSVCAENTGVYGTCIYFEFIAELQIANVTFSWNLSLESVGGTLAFWLGDLMPSTTVVIQDSFFEGNSAMRGGVFSFEALNSIYIHLTITNCLFLRNHADMHGSVLSLPMPNCLAAGSILSKNSFEENTGLYGVIWLMFYGGTLRITDSLFRNNTGAEAAALSIESVPGAATIIENVQFIKNFGGPTILKTNSRMNSTFVTQNCSFLENEGGDVMMEGGIWNDTRSTYCNSTVSEVLLSFGAAAFVSVARFESNRVSESGGALHLMSGSFFRCEDCVFLNNSAGYAGGAIFVEQESTIVLRNCIFRNNSAETGGGVFFFTSSQSTESLIDSCLIEDNNGGNFGVIFAQTTNFELRNVTMRANSGVECPGITLLMTSVTITSSLFQSMAGVSAAFAALYTSSSAVITDCTFEDGRAHNGGILYLSSSSAVTVSHCSFTNMELDQGGVVAAFSSSRVELSDVTMWDAHSSTTGALIYMSDSSLVVTHSKFKNYHLGGIFGYQLDSVDISSSEFSSGAGLLGGAGYFYQCTSVLISQCVFSLLSASDGGVLYFEALENKQAGTVTIERSQFLENAATIGGALNINNHKIEITGSEFIGNKAEIGGAISSDCTISEMCAISVSESVFRRNSATVKGGAISWLSMKPTLSNVTFDGNAAQYGADISSFSISMRIDSLAPQSKRHLTPGNDSSDVIEIAPGQTTQTAIAVSLRDHYSQRVSIDNSSVGQIDCVNCTVSGQVRVTAEGGVMLFDGYIVYASPGSLVVLVVGSSAIVPSHLGDPDPHFPSISLSLRVRQCLPGEYQTSDSCTKCSSGTYSFHPDTPCKTCPANAQCLGNFTMYPNPGFWRSGIYSSEVRDCPNEAACLGGNVPQLPLNLTGFCASGYKGNLCQSCADDCSRTGKNKCEKCPERDSNITRLTLIIAAVIVLVVVMVWSTLRSAARFSTHSILIRIFVNYLQLVLLVSDFKLQWPSQVLRLFESQEAMGGVIEQVYSVDCFLNDSQASTDTYYKKMVLMVILPVPLLTLSVLFWLVVAVRKRALRVVKQEGAATVVILYFLVLPSLVKSLFSMFSCTTIEPGEYWLAADMDIRCWHSQHFSSAMTVGVPGVVVWVFGVPLLCLLLVWRLRKRLDERVVKMQFGFLVNGYRQTAFFWEFVILYRKIAIICIAVFFTTSVPLQALTVQLILLIALFIQYKVRPFTEALLNSVEIRSIMVADVTIFCGLYYITKDMSEVMTWFLFLLIIVSNILFVGFWTYALLGHCMRLLITRSWIVRRLFGLEVDRELEALISEMTPCRDHVNMQENLQQCYRKMLSAKIVHFRQNVSFISFYSSSFPESLLLS